MDQFAEQISEVSGAASKELSIEQVCIVCFVKNIPELRNEGKEGCPVAPLLRKSWKMVKTNMCIPNSQ